MKRLLQEKDGCIVFSLSTILPVFVTLVFAIAIAGLESPTEEIWYLYAQYLLTQVSFAIVLVAYFAKTKISLRDAGVRGCRPQYFLIALILQIGIFFGLSDLNLIFIEKLGDWFGYEPTVAALPPTEGWWLVLTLFVVAVLPAVCEELIFRGFMVQSTRSCGMVFCVLVNGLFFALFHQNPAQTLYQFVCGCVFALIACRSGSILPTVVVHFLNNAAVVILARFGIDELTGPWSTAAAIVSLVLFVACVVLLCLQGRKDKERNGNRKAFLLASAIGVIVCAVSWVASLALSVAS